MADLPKNCADCPFSEDRQLGRNRLHCGHLDKVVYAHHGHRTDCVAAFNTPQKNNVALKFQGRKKRKKEPKELVLKIMPCHDGAWFVQSESTPNAYYRSNRETGHCSCASQKPCKHLQAVDKRFRLDGTNIEIEPISPSFLYLVYRAGDHRSVGQLGKHHGEFVFTMDGRIVAKNFDLCRLVSEIETSLKEVYANV